MSLRSLSASSLHRPSARLAEARWIGVSGIGIHTGRSFEVRMEAAQAGNGLSFVVEYPDGDCVAPALWTRLSGTTRSTALVLRSSTGRKAEVRTIEHLLAALWTLGNPNLKIVIRETPSLTVSADAAMVFEVPILDGAASDWMDVIAAHPRLFDLSGGISRTLKVWRVERAFELTDGEKRVSFEPPVSQPFLSRYETEVDFGVALRQQARFDADWRDRDGIFRSFRTELAPARTFGFKHEIDELHRRGLAQGGSLQNAILLDGDRVVNTEGFRVENELARHKLLDAIGDMALLGAPVIGTVKLRCAGHSMHLAALKDAVKAQALVAGVLNLDTGAFAADPL